MRRFIRRLFVCLNVACLVLLGATVVMWVRSYRFADEYAWKLPATGGCHHPRAILSVDGAIGYVREDSSYPWLLGSEAMGWRSSTSKKLPRSAISPNDIGIYEKGFAGIYILRVTNPGGFAGAGIWALAVRYWVLAVLTALPSATWLMRRLVGRLVARSRRRRDPGLCAGCGYDLRAGHERCPECGRGTGRGASAGTSGSSSAKGSESVNHGRGG